MSIEVIKTTSWSYWWREAMLSGMAAAVLFGAGSGALHAVTGPDHVLSLGPAALLAPRGSFRVGLRWGAGHALGTVVLALPLLLLSSVIELSVIAGVAERLAGLALLVMAAWSWWCLRRARHEDGVDGRSPVVVGFVHGATGAGSLLLVLPVLVSGDAARTASFLAAFALGSTAAMALLTALLGRVGARLERRVVTTLQKPLLLAAATLGACWLVL